MKEKTTLHWWFDFLVTLFLGFIGVHRFIKKDFKMGFVYLVTAGVFLIGWILDIIKCFKNDDKIELEQDDDYVSLMGEEGIEAINSGLIPEIKGTYLNLSKEETCCYVDNAYTYSDKVITTGYSGKRTGSSFKITKGLAYNIGEHTTKAIRELERTTYNGILYITTKRVVFTAEKGSFNKDFNKITSVQEVDYGLIIQLDSKTLPIVTNTNKEFVKIFNILKDIDEKDASLLKRCEINLNASNNKLTYTI